MSFHSVTLDTNKCKGCINCVKRCPTEAIRVKDGKAFILSERCVDCGECIRICHNHAKKAVYDKLEIIHNYKYKVALPAPSLYPQFNNLDSAEIILDGLKEIGFDDVFEVAAAAEIVSEISRGIVKNEDIKRPVISNACPVIVRLVQVRFPKLIPHIHNVLPPVEVAAKIARSEAVKKTGLSEDEIGVFFISPCPAKVTALHYPKSDKKTVDGVLSASEVYLALLPALKKIENPESEHSAGLTGLSWSYTGGESTSLLVPKYLAADGIENCIKILDEIENGKLNDIDFVELDACFSGCVGGCLNIENPYVAITKVRKIRKFKPVSVTHLSTYSDFDVSDFMSDVSLESSNAIKLADDPKTAMEIMLKIDEIEQQLPGIDCASCGSPSCSCFAQDVATGKADITDCVFILNKKLMGEKSSDS